MSIPFPRRQDVLTSAGGCLVAVVLLIGATYIPKPLFDPVGSAAFPRACAVALIVLSICVLIESVLKVRKAQIQAASSEPPVTRAAMMLGLMFGFLAMLQIGLGYTLATAAFVPAGIYLISGDRRLAVYGIALGLGLGVVCNYVFNSIFYIALPQFSF